MRKRHSLWFHILDVVFNIVIIVAIVVAIRTFLVSPFQVEGNSMVDTLEHKEYIIINKLTYILGEPERGDVVVFRPPNDLKKHYVKRIIGRGGDEVVIEEGYVFVKPNGKDQFVQIEEPYLNRRNNGRTYNHPPNSGDSERKEYKIPEGMYFLLGDNRQGSLDSRSFVDENGDSIPYVPEKNIKGRVWFIALPINKIKSLEPASYGY